MPQPHAFQPMLESPPSSPCIKACILDAAGYCVGCRRSREEIARWTTMTTVEQWQVIDAVERRRLTNVNS
jgi:predicted Fe-S protein YdhL (DUF1289 family)